LIAGLVALCLAACGVHRPADRFRAAAWTPPARDDATLIGGPQRGSSIRQSDGFVLVGGPPARPLRLTRARSDTVNGFQMTSTDDPDPAQAASGGADPGGSGQAADPTPAARPDPGATTAVVRALHASQSRPASADPAADPPANDNGGLKALALWPMPSAQIAPPAEPELKPQVVGQSPIQAGQIVMFLLCLLGAVGLWAWHRRCARDPSSPQGLTPAQ
jgi:hypothetical protein